METVISALTEYRVYFIGGAVIAGIVWGVMKLLRRSQQQTQRAGQNSVNIQAGRDAKVDRLRID